MPATLAALRAGRVSEWRATLLVRETACCTRHDRAVIDQTVAGDPDRLERLSDNQLVGEVRRLAYRLDPHALVDRHSRAVADRSVTLRPALDTVTYLTALAEGDLERAQRTAPVTLSPCLAGEESVGPGVNAPARLSGPPRTSPG